MSSSLEKKDRSWTVFAVLILLIGALNFLFPHNFFLFAVNHLSYLPRMSQVTWTFFAAVLVVLMVLTSREARKAGIWIAALAVIFVVSLCLFRTSYPTFHGDGFYGGGGHVEGDLSIFSYPGPSGRLQSLLALNVSHLVPAKMPFTFHHCRLDQEPHWNNTWILLTMMCGMGLIALAAITAWRLNANRPARIGLMLTLLCSAPMLNAYGHFDSYVVPVLCAALWFVAAAKLRGPPYRPHAWVLLAIALLFAMWAHPLLLCLAGYSVLLALLAVLDTRGKVVPAWAVAVMGVAAGFLPFAARTGDFELFRPETEGVLPWLLHQKMMLSLQVGLPAILLAAIVLWRNRKRPRDASPLRDLAVIMLVSAMLMCFTIRVGFGLRDEFIYSMLGTIMLGAALLLWFHYRESGHLLLYTGALSLYLFLPSVYVYSNHLIIDRYRDHVLLDRCSNNRSCSPYRTFALCLPAEDSSYRQERLKTLRKGFTEPLPHLEPFREENRAFYTAWCFEMGDYANGRQQLEILLDTRSGLLPELWERNGPFYTETYLHRSFWIARKMSEDLAKEKWAENPDDSFLQAALEHLKQLEERDPPEFKRIR